MIQSNLICNFCEEEFNLSQKIPRMITKCGHSICEACLKIKIDEKNDFNCPIDYTVISPHFNLIDDFPKNLQLIEIIQFKIKEEIKRNEINIISFRENNFENHKFNNLSFEKEKNGLEEKNNFVNENNGFNNTNNFKENNSEIENEYIELAYSNDSNIEDMCGIHVKELSIFCNECGILICFDCALQNHRGHTFKNLEDVNEEIKNFKNKLDKFYLGIEKKTKNIKNEFFKIVYNPRLKKKYSFLKVKVNEIYEKEIKIIEKKKQNAINQLKIIFKDKEKYFDKTFDMKLSLDIKKIEIWKKESQEIFTILENNKKKNLGNLMNSIKNLNEDFFSQGQEIYRKLRKNLNNLKKEIKENFEIININENIYMPMHKNIYKEMPNVNPVSFYYKRSQRNSDTNSQNNFGKNSQKNIKKFIKYGPLNENKNFPNKNNSLRNFHTNSVNNFQIKKNLVSNSKGNLLINNKTKLPKFLLQKNPKLDTTSNYFDDHSTENNICSASFLKKNNNVPFNGFSSVHNLVGSQKNINSTYFDKRFSNKRYPLKNKLKNESLNLSFGKEQKDENLLDDSYVDILDDFEMKDNTNFSKVDIVYSDFYGNKKYGDKQKNNGKKKTRKKNLQKMNNFDKHNIYKNIKVPKKKIHLHTTKNDKKVSIKKKKIKNSSNKFKNLEKQLLKFEPEDLNLSNLKIKSQHLNSISKILNKSKNLKTLDLSKNIITDNGIKIFCSIFKKSKLKYINLSNNLLTENSFEFLLKYIEENIFLKNIGFENNQCTFDFDKKKIIQTFGNKGVFIKL